MVSFIRFVFVLALTLWSSEVAMSAEEITPGGSKVHRYESPESGFQAPRNQAEHFDELSDYLTGFLGRSEDVWHEIVSDKVHIDVLPFPPTEERPFWTFVTSGMSDLPMDVPEGVEPRDDYRYSEVVVSLPPEWFPGAKSVKDIDFDEDNYWPIRILKFIARFPHEYDAWIWASHTMPNGDPAEPYSSKTRLSGVILLPPATWPVDKLAFKRSDGATVHFHAIYPLHDDEMAIKLSKGTDVLLDLMVKADLTEILDLNRKSVAQKRGRLLDLFRK